MSGKIALLLVIGVKLTTGAFGPKMGPYEIEILKMEQCEDPGSGKIYFPSRITFVGKGKYFYNETFKLEEPVDENTRAVLELQKWGNGGWRKRAVQYTVKNCEDLWRRIGDQIHEAFKYTNLTKDISCPFPPGLYVVNNWPVSLNLTKVVPVMEYAKYRLVVKFYHKDEYVGCMMFTVNMVPKDA
ncbi:uncharacterized protein LOC128988198 isoform X1 [Macrosteles quadrilineatus]|uniref:uncharacterized protein LOC128988198 isoform X1 n=2 Tax=Macrosteles quadrilineatus TaxID=74068 RepID=UPI0023E091AE|nr:uncharacterized protein LOC128988198 isoform X1 [Macrosteles quadrilineatus]